MKSTMFRLVQAWYLDGPYVRPLCGTYRRLKRATQDYRLV